MVFTEQAAWQTAVDNSFTTETFNTAAPIDPILQGITTDVGNGLSVLYERADDVLGPVNDPKIQLNVAASKMLQLRTDPLGTQTTAKLQLVFDQPIRAFAANFRSVDDGEGLTLTINGEITDIDAQLGLVENGFLGWVSHDEFSVADFGGPSITVFKLNDAFTSQVPEPSTALALLALGLVGLGSFAARPRRGAKR